MMTALATGSASVFQRAVALVVGDRDDDGLVRRVRAHRDLALERLAVRAPEVAERLGADAADAGVAILRVDDLALALVLDVGQLELLAEDRGELVERDVDLEHVLAGALARPCLPPSPSSPSSPPTGSPGSPSPCPAPPCCLSPKRKRGMSICGIGIETRSLPLRPMSSPCEMYFRRFCRIRPRTMCAEARVVLVDLQRHRCRYTL